MLRYLHRLSAFFFYVLGSGFFVAYILWRNEMGGGWPLRWLTEADLPMLLASLLYGGLSVYLSIDPHETSKTLRWTMFGLMTVCFLAFLVLNFWNRFSL